MTLLANYIRKSPLNHSGDFLINKCLKSFSIRFFLPKQLTNSLYFAILYLVLNNYAALAQLVEHHHGKVGVVGSSPTGGFLGTLIYQRSFFISKTNVLI